MLTRDAILAAAPKGFGAVEVPEWGGSVTLRCLSLDDLFVWEELRASDAADARQRSAATLIRLAVCDADGAPIFSEADMPWLMAQPGFLLSRVGGAILKHAGAAGSAEGN